MKRNLLAVMTVVLALAGNTLADENTAQVEFKRDDDRGEMKVLVAGKEALEYRYGKELDLAHFFPVLSPSGKPLTIQYPASYPHHRSIWFADQVEFAPEGESKPKQGKFYFSFQSRKNAKDPQSPYVTHVRHVEFLPVKSAGDQAEIAMRLLWETDEGKTPMADLLQELRVVSLGQGEYFLELKFTVTAAYGDLKFVSDQGHYAWPYVRMSPEFSQEKGAAVTATEGPIALEITSKHPVVDPTRWVDYSNTVGGATEGLALFSDPQLPKAPHWFVRHYGTFGPRRPDEQNGKPFQLKKGESLHQHVGLLIHSGDVKAGHVADRYQQFVDGKL